MKEWIVKEECTLKEFTDSHDPQASFFFERLLKLREIKINGERVGTERGAEVRLKVGDEVRYYLTKEQEAKVAFEIVYEDDHLMVTDKYDGVNSEAVYETLARERGQAHVFFIHRLDRNTQGIMIFAKDGDSAEALKQAFLERTVEKTYLAVLKNNFSKNETERCGVVTEKAYLAKDSSRALVRVAAKPFACSEQIVTAFEPLQKKDDLALCKIYLHTGKTHQIRAHSAFLKRPVLGDTKYGDKALNKKYGRTRQCLIAKNLTLHFPKNSSLFYADGKSFTSRFSFQLTSF